MTQEHPITPPPELIRELIEGTPLATGVAREMHLITAAFQAGADQELEACCEILRGEFNYHHLAEPLRAARRPKPPSLKERALQAWAAVEAGTDDQTAMAVIRRALEQLDD